MPLHQHIENVLQGDAVQGIAGMVTGCWHVIYSIVGGVVVGSNVISDKKQWRRQVRRCGERLGGYPRPAAREAGYLAHGLTAHRSLLGYYFTADYQGAALGPGDHRWASHRATTATCFGLEWSRLQAAPFAPLKTRIMIDVHTPRTSTGNLIIATGLAWSSEQTR